MGLFPFIGAPNGVNNKPKTLPVFREYAWDFTNNDLILVDGVPQIVEKNEALKVWIYKALKAQRYRYLGYSLNYGSEIEDNLIGKGLSARALQIEAERYCREAIERNPYIKQIKDIKVEKDKKDKDLLVIELTVDTVYGEVTTIV